MCAVCFKTSTLQFKQMWFCHFYVKFYKSANSIFWNTHDKKAIVNIRLCSGSAPWWVAFNKLPIGVTFAWPIMAKHNVTTKPAVHIVLHCRQRRIEPWPLATVNMYWKFCEVWTVQHHTFAKPSLWSPYVIGQTIIFSSCFFLLLLLLSFFSSPNLSSRRLDVYYTLAHGVALVRI